MPAVEDKDVSVFSEFFGLRNNVAEEAFAPGDLSIAQNVDINDELKLRRRKGFAAVAIAGNFHSLYSDGSTVLAVSGTSLIRVFPESGSTSTIRTGLTVGKRMSYASVGVRIYYSNGHETGCVDGGVNRSWGLVPPVTQPSVSVVGGGLPAGRYQFAITFVRDDGQESGTGVSGVMNLQQGSGIRFSDLPVSGDPTVVLRRVYISAADSDTMFLRMELPSTSNEAFYYFETAPVMPLITQFMSPPPPGQVVSYFNGRTIAARGPRAYYSEPYAPELFDLRRGVRFKTEITIVAPVRDGVYFGTRDEVVFVSGNDISSGVYSQKRPYGAIPGTLAYVSAENVSESGDENVPLFATKQGICAGFSGGVMKNLTEGRFSYPATERGAAVVRKHGGMSQYLVSLEGTEAAANVAF